MILLSSYDLKVLNLTHGTSSDLLSTFSSTIFKHMYLFCRPKKKNCSSVIGCSLVGGSSSDGSLAEDVGPLNSEGLVSSLHYCEVNSHLPKVFELCSQHYHLNLIHPNFHKLLLVLIPSTQVVQHSN